MSDPVGVLERIANAQERSATALEGILEAVGNFSFEKVGEVIVANTLNVETQDAPAEVADEAPAEEAAVEEVASTEADDQASEEAAEDSAPAAEDEAPAEAEAEPEEPDPLGDGDPVETTAIEIPKKLTTEHVRDLARRIMDSEGKPAVFETLAVIGVGYKAVGEISESDLEEAFIKMSERLNP